MSPHRIRLESTKRGDPKYNDVGLPVRPFMYTLDQIANLMEMKQSTLEESHVYFNGRTVGVPLRSEMKAQNIAARDEKPDWRIPDREFIRWLRHKGFKYYDVGTIGSR